MASSTNNNFEQQLEAYIAHMNEELHTAQLLIEAMEQAEQDKSKYGPKAQQYLHLLLEILKMDTPLLEQLGITDPSKLTTKQLLAIEKKFFPEAYKHYESLEGHVDKDDAVIKKEEQALAKIDPNLSGMLTKLNALIEKSEALLRDGCRSSDVEKAVGQINKIFLELCQAILSKIQTDLAEKGMEKFGSDPSHAAAILELAGIAIRGEFSEQSHLQNIQNDVTEDITGWQSEKSKAEADLKTWHWYNVFGGGPDRAKEHAIIRAANAMMSLLRSVEAMISPLISQIDPGMQEINIELDELKKKFNQFLHGHGTLQELKDAMIVALSIMVGIIAETSKDASMYDKEMSTGAMASMKMHLADSLDQEKVIEDAKKYASVMGKLMTAAKYMGMSLLLLISPSAAMAFMMLLDATLNATGVMDKMQSALSKKTGSVWGASLTAVIEAGGTTAGAAALEAIVSKVVIESAIEASAQATQKVLATTIQNTTDAAVNAAGGIGRQEANEVVTQAVTQALETSQKKAADVLLTKTMPEMLSYLAKGGMKEAMALAQKEAMENAAQEVQILAETAAKQGSSEIVGAKTVEAIAKKSADQATSKAFNISEKDAAKMGEKSFVAKLSTRAAFSYIAAMGTTDMWSYSIAGMKHEKKKDLSEEWQTALQIINTLMEIFGTLGASGQGIETLQTPGVMPKALLGLEALSGSATSLSSIGESAAYFEQSKAVTAVAKDQAGLDLMQFVLEQLQKEGEAQRDAYTKEAVQAGQTNLKLSEHFNDAQAAVARALSVSAV